jgi:hypothetical protein
LSIKIKSMSTKAPTCQPKHQQAKQKTVQSITSTQHIMRFTISREVHHS